MSALEISLLIIGIVCVVLSFIISEKIESGKEKELELEISKEQENILKRKIDSMIDEQLEGLEEKTEITLDKISNRKIMELSEYSDTVLSEINKNHNETVFLYDMLNEKTKEVKNILSDVNQPKTKAKSKTTKKETKDISIDSYVDTIVEDVKAAKEEIKEEIVVQEENETKELIVAETIKAEVPKKPGRKPKKKETSTEKDKKDTILELYNSGKSYVDIAKELNMGTGEVKLIVDLYKNAK